MAPVNPKAEKGQAEGECVSSASGENLCLPGQLRAWGPRGRGAGTRVEAAGPWLKGW